MSESPSEPSPDAAAEPQPEGTVEPQPAAEPTTEAPAEPAAPQAPPAAAPERSVLRRSRDDRVIAGVCGGLGQYFGIDAVILRIAFVVLLLAGGTGILLYIVGWIAIPEERPGEVVAAAPRGAHDRSPGAEVVGIGLVLLGIFFLLREVFPDVFDSDYLWPLVLIAIGVAVLARAVRR
ncbi:MAG TPA: PspC domain-containing protein [Gaiellaceae bacterium]|nr:PspC domain-containing protein [Gaiellaceae bacterium]